jgi:hypothetical protein
MAKFYKRKKSPAFIASKKVYKKPMIPKRFPKKTFAPYASQIGKAIGSKATPDRLLKFMNTAIDYVVRGKSETAKRILKELAKPMAIKVGNEIYKLTNPPVAGVASPSSDPQILGVEDSWKQVSGTNHLYTAREYRLNITSGRSKRGWLSSIEKTNGRVNVKTVDTTELYHLDDAARSNLTKVAGIGRKTQQLINSNLFGWTFQDLRTYFSMTTYDTSNIREQVAYGAVTKLNSKMTITNLNKYVPTYIKVNLVRNKVVGSDPINSYRGCINSVDTIQVDGAMPLYIQQGSIPAETILGQRVFVDPKSKGIKSSEIFKAGFEIVESKQFKLAAGDRLKINYDHLCGSGVRLDKLHGIERDSSFSDKHPVTYLAMIETWGEEVDAYLTLDASRVIKATAPTSIQFETSKTIYGVMPSESALQLQNSSGYKGYLSESFAIKLYSKSPLVTTTRRYYDFHSNLGTVYKVPVMSDAVEQSAGQIT